VDFPASSPFATSIGGTSLALRGGNLLFETGWGNNLTRIADVASAGSPPVVPPNNSAALGLGFQFGAGGGPSLTFAKPSWQAALLLYGLSAGIRDVKAVGSANNVQGTVNGTPWTADQLAAPLFNTTTYYSAFYNSPFSTRWFVITFGTDTGLTTGPGWDNVT